eukprot:762747-Hanusia_phi.AAC.4
MKGGGDEMVPTSTSAQEKMQKMGRSSFKRKCAEMGIRIPVRGLERSIASSPMIAREILAYRTRNMLIFCNKDVTDFAAIVFVHDGKEVEAAGDPSTWPPHTIERILEGERFLARARLRYGSQGLALGKKKESRTIRLGEIESMTLGKDFCDELRVQLKSRRRSPTCMEEDGVESAASGSGLEDTNPAACQGCECNGSTCRVGKQLQAPRSDLGSSDPVFALHSQRKLKLSLALWSVSVVCVWGVLWASNAFLCFFPTRNQKIPFIL